jgi:hypothetical protein
MAEGGYRHAAAWSVASILFLAGAAGGAHLHGLRSRHGAPPGRAQAVATPEEATRRWAELGVRGRTLLLFDHYPRALAVREAPSARPASAEHFVQAAILANLVRRVYLVLPDEQWDAFRAQGALYRILSPAPGLPRAVSLYTSSGAPLVALPASALPPLDEEVLVYVDAAVFDPAWVGQLLDRAGLRSDVPLVHLRRGG